MILCSLNTLLVFLRSCAHQYETSQEMAAATLAYKCTEVACMRLVYGRSLGLSGEWNELQKMVQMTPQGTIVYFIYDHIS